MRLDLTVVTSVRKLRRVSGGAEGGPVSSPACAAVANGYGAWSKSRLSTGISNQGSWTRPPAWCRPAARTLIRHQEEGNVLQARCDVRKRTDLRGDGPGDSRGGCQ